MISRKTAREAVMTRTKLGPLQETTVYHCNIIPRALKLGPHCADKLDFWSADAAQPSLESMYRWPIFVEPCYHNRSNSCMNECSTGES